MGESRRKRQGRLAPVDGDVTPHEVVDAPRRALERIVEPASAAGMRPGPMRSVREALDQPWVLDVYASSKPLYGRQQGAAPGCIPGKPGRPSQVMLTHSTYWSRCFRFSRVCADTCLAKALPQASHWPDVLQHILPQPNGVADRTQCGRVTGRQH
jgi:hypothetical protein